MYVCVYICMCEYTGTYTCTHICVYIYIHIFNFSGRLDKTLQDAEKQIIFHAVEQMDKDSIAYLVLAA